MSFRIIRTSQMKSQIDTSFPIPGKGNLNKNDDTGRIAKKKNNPKPQLPKTPKTRTQRILKFLPSWRSKNGKKIPLKHEEVMKQKRPTFERRAKSEHSLLCKPASSTMCEKNSQRTISPLNHRNKKNGDAFCDSPAMSLRSVLTNDTFLTAATVDSSASWSSTSLSSKSASCRHLVGISKPPSSFSFEVQEGHFPEEPLEHAERFDVNIATSLPRKYIEMGSVHRAASLLKNETFIQERIGVFGMVNGAQLHVSDCEKLQKYKPASVLVHGSFLDRTPEYEEEQEIDEMECDDDDSLYSMESEIDTDIHCTTPQNIYNHVCEGEYCAKIITIDAFEKYATQCSFIHGVSHEESAEAIGESVFILGLSLHKSGWIEDAMFLYQMGLAALPPITSGHAQEHAHFGKDYDCDDADTAFSSCFFLTGRILRKMGDIHASNEEYQDALSVYENSMTILQSQHSPTNSPIAYHSVSEPRVSASTVAREVTKLFLQMGHVHGKTQGFESALSCYQQAYNIQVSVSDDKANKILSSPHDNIDNHNRWHPNTLETGNTLHNIGVIKRHLHDLNGAMVAYKRALSILTYHLGTNHLTVAQTLNNMGGIYRRQGSYEDAMKCYEGALKIRKLHLGPGHASVGLTLAGMGSVAKSSGRKEEANIYFKEALR